MKKLRTAIAKHWRDILIDGAALSGCGLIVWGASILHAAAGLIVAGVFLFAGAVFVGTE